VTRTRCRLLGAPVGCAHRGGVCSVIWDRGGRGQAGPSCASLETHRDRCVALATVLGGLRSGEVRSLRLADVDMGLRRLRVVGKGGRERIVAVDGAFFAECAIYLEMSDRLDAVRR